MKILEINLSVSGSVGRGGKGWRIDKARHFILLRLMSFCFLSRSGLGSLPMEKMIAGALSLSNLPLK